MDIRVEYILIFFAIALPTAFLLWVLRALAGGGAAASPSAEEHEPELPVEELLLLEHRPVPRGATGRFDRWFETVVAGTGLDIVPVAAFLLMIFLGILAGGIAWFWTDEPLVAGLAFAVGFFGGAGWLFYLRSRRLQKFDEQLPEVMEVMAQAVRAGQTFDQAVEMVSHSSLKPASTELGVCARKLHMGLSVEETLRALTRRIPLPDVSMFSAAVIMQRRTGGRLATTLERLAQAIRERHGYRRQVRTATAGARWSSTLIVVLAIGLVIYLFGWQQQYVQSFLTTQIGRIVLAIAVVLQVVGIVWVFVTSRPEY